MTCRSRCRAPGTFRVCVAVGVRALRVDGDRLVWVEQAPNATPDLAHPEWSSTIWARARARLLSAPSSTGALSLDSSQVVAFSTDAIYATCDPHWPDDGTVGRWRLKETRHAAAWPTRWTDLRTQEMHP